MKKNHGDEHDEEMKAEYDLAKMRTRGRGIYADRYAEGTNVRLLKPELAEQFRDDQAVNEALEEYLKLKRESA